MLKIILSCYKIILISLIVYSYMDFFIRQGSTEPVLKMRLIDDGINDKSSFNERLENSIITFEMHDVKSNVPHILNGVCYLTTRIKKFNNVDDEYYIIFKFSEEDTSMIGRFEGKFTIQFQNTNLSPSSKLIVPIQEKLFVNVI